MALHAKIFQTRALTAIVFVAVMLAGLLLGKWSFFLLFTLIHFGCWWEFLILIDNIHKEKLHRYLKLGFMLMGYGIMLLFVKELEIFQFDVASNFSFTFLAAGTLMALLGVIASRKIKADHILSAAAGWLYISLSCGLMMDLYNYPTENITLLEASAWYSIFLPIFIIGCMWINDTMAYIVGSLIGKTPLTSISPKKTWEGTLGGIILCALIAGFTAHTFDDGAVFNFGLFFWILLAAIAAIAGTLGDLLESKLKRLADVKDSGSLMPGHGGFLDRFDSLLVATPIVWLLITIFK